MFFGFYTLYVVVLHVFCYFSTYDVDGLMSRFWLVVGLFIVRTLGLNYMEGKHFFESHIIEILNRDLYKIALTDAVMWAFSFFGVFLQLAVKRGYLSWRKTGWVMQNVSLAWPCRVGSLEPSTTPNC